MKISDETKVGIFAAFGITILILGYSFLKGNNLFQKKSVFYAVYNRVDGLNPSDPVTFNGLIIGKVKKLNLLNDTLGKVIAEIELQKEISIPSDSYFELYSSDLLGEKAVKLVRGRSPQQANVGDTLKGFVQATLQEEVSMQMLPVKKKAEDLFTSIDTVINIIRIIISGGKIESSLDNIELATERFGMVAKDLDSLIVTQTNKISRILTHIEGITANLDSNSENITQILDNFGGIADSLNRADLKSAVRNLDTALVALNVLLTRINTAEGSLGLLVNDKELYNNLVQSLANLESLLADIEENPRRYINVSIFGGGGSGERKSKKQAR
ncbi:MAG: organic solvent ABC transporter substrate-binding protein [Chitinophagales bacterium]|nr:MAG: organic solvent ABC transporter substrate-binding protein [Chitinophagales bacterium]